MKHEELYKITVNRDQLMLIADCIEDIFRFAAGQPELYHTIGTLLARHDDSCEKREEIEYHLREVKKMIYPDLRGNASYGYHGGDQKDPLRKNLIGNTYQIYKSILHFLAVHENWDNVHSGIPLESGNLGTVKIEKI